MRNRKLFIAVAAMAMVIAAVAAASALAAYHSEEKTTNFRGSMQTSQVWTTNILNPHCPAATFNADNVQATEKGSKDFAVDSLFVHPLYGKATGSGEDCQYGGLTTSISTAGCDYEFGLTEPISEGSAQAKMHIGCIEGKKIKMENKGLKCTEEFPTQDPSGVVTFTNVGNGAKREIEARFEITNLAYTWSAGCPGAKNKAGSATNGTYVGNVRFKGVNSATASQVGIWVK